MRLTDTSKRRLTIAKELYTHGYVHSKSRAPSDSILSILNFDYCNETIVKAVLLDKQMSLTEKRYPKSFDKLIDELKALYPNIGFLSEVISLHKLRNDVQHLAVVPSIEEVERHRVTSRSFFDEVCREVYEEDVTFSKVSLAFFVRSEGEIMVLSEMERAFQENNFQLSVYYARNAIKYHVMLLRENMKIPHSSRFLFDPSQSLTRGLDHYVRDIDEKINWLIDRICLREYYDEIEEILGGVRFRFWEIIEIKDATKEEAERSRNVTYDFITRTQDLVKEVKLPTIFDLRVIDKTENECVIQLGIASDFKITNAFIRGVSQANPLPLIEVKFQTGIQTVRVENLKKGETYTLEAGVSNEKDGESLKYLRFTL